MALSDHAPLYNRRVGSTEVKIDVKQLVESYFVVPSRDTARQSSVSSMLYLHPLDVLLDPHLKTVVRICHVYRLFDQGNLHGQGIFRIGYGMAAILGVVLQQVAWRERGVWISSCTFDYWYSYAQDGVAESRASISKLWVPAKQYISYCAQKRAPTKVRSEERYSFFTDSTGESFIERCTFILEKLIFDIERSFLLESWKQCFLLLGNEQLITTPFVEKDAAEILVTSINKCTCFLKAWNAVDNDITRLHEAEVKSLLAATPQDVVASLLFLRVKREVGAYVPFREMSRPECTSSAEVLEHFFRDCMMYFNYTECSYARSIGILDACSRITESSPNPPAPALAKRRTQKRTYSEMTHPAKVNDICEPRVLKIIRTAYFSGERPSIRFQDCSTYLVEKTILSQCLLPLKDPQLTKQEKKTTTDYSDTVKRESSSGPVKMATDLLAWTPIVLHPGSKLQELATSYLSSREEMAKRDIVLQVSDRTSANYRRSENKNEK